MDIFEQITDASTFLQKKIPGACPQIAVVLGSGLGPFADTLEGQTSVETSEIPHWPVPTVQGHRGRVVFGRVSGIPILALQGRVHFYEGYSIQQVVFPIRVLGQMGVQSLIVSNAAGSLNTNFLPGDLMLITDHINFMFTHPLIGYPPTSSQIRFPDMSQPYDLKYIHLAEIASHDLSIPLKKGILVASTGPSYETAAEIRMMRSLGGDAVCMSTVPEVIAGVAMGLRILGISCITNLGTGLSSQKLTHQEVEKTAQKMKEKFIALVKEIVVRISEKS